MFTLLDIQNSTDAANTPDEGVTRLFINDEDTLCSVDDVGVVKEYDVAGSSNAGPCLPVFTGLKYVRGFVSNSLVGENDIYTVPAGKKAIVSASRVYNTNVATSLTYYTLKVSGTYYRINGNSSNATNAGSIVNIGNTGFVLNSGETISLNSDKTGVNCSATILEFDDTVPVYTAKILALENGNNTLLTVPENKTAILLTLITFAPSSILNVSNSTGGSLNYIYYAVPNGGSAGSTNQLIPSTAAANITLLSQSTIGTMEEGDSLVVNTSAGTAGQVAWVNYYLI